MIHRSIFLTLLHFCYVIVQRILSTLCCLRPFGNLGASFTLSHFHPPTLPSYDAYFDSFFNTSFFRFSIFSCFRFSSSWICFFRIWIWISIFSCRIDSVSDRRTNESDLCASESAICASESVVCFPASTNASLTPNESAFSIANVSFSWSKNAILNAWLCLPVIDDSVLPCDADMEMDACRRR